MWFLLKISSPRKGQLSFDFDGGEISYISLLKLKRVNQNTNMKGVSNASMSWKGSHPRTSKAGKALLLDLDGGGWEEEKTSYSS